jgi:leucyl aminopeptidase
MNSFILRLLVGSLILISSSFASTPKKLITIGRDLKEAAFPQGKSNYKHGIFEDDELSLIEVSESDFKRISHLAHEKFNRCGGFMVHENEDMAWKEVDNKRNRLSAQKSVMVDYGINQQATVTNLIKEVQETNIREVILKLSSFKNRYYKSESGSKSSIWLSDYWKSLVAHRSDITVNRWNHSSWPQDTIIVEIKGKTDDKIVIGGHADSIAGWWGRERARAPGADDNASGIATMTEILRVLVNSNYQPQNTIVFAAYAAEEVGLLGSKEVAKSFKDDGENVLGVLQLDMTNFNGSDLDIVLMSDYTNEAQNKFIGGLIDTYLPGLSWGYDKCGYACSDHASWNSQGYPASMPFEAKKGDSNRHIHSDKDTLSRSGDNADHAQKFAKMGVAFVLELDN